MFDVSADEVAMLAAAAGLTEVHRAARRDMLLRADLGTEVAERISAAVGVGRYDKSITEDDVKALFEA